jgi:hypothetical protein
METYWADITVKVTADSYDEAMAIIQDSATQMTSIYDGQVKLIGIEAEQEVG